MSDIARDDLAVLIPALRADWIIRVSGDRPLSADRQSAINQRLAELWCKFLGENQAEWESLGLTWESHFLHTKQYHPVAPTNTP